MLMNGVNNRTLFLVALVGFLALVVAAAKETNGPALIQALKAVSSRWKKQDLGGSAPDIKPFTEIGGTCDRLTSSSDSNRVACSSPEGVVYIYNAQITPGNITFYYGGGASDIAVSTGLQHIALPALESVTNRVKTSHYIRVLRSKEKFESAQCPNGIIDSTLHVVGLKQGQNLFHALNDNIMALFSQIVLDSHLDRRYLEKPRHLVVAGPALQRSRASGSQIPDTADRIFRTAVNAFGEDGVTGSSPLVPHFRLLKGDFQVGLRGGGSECYRRIIWGNGARLLYHPELSTLRSQTADLLREFVRIKFDPPVPSAFLPPPSTGLKDKLRVAVFLRDPHGPGNGRSMGGEQMIAEYLSKNASSKIVSSWCWGHVHSSKTDSLIEQLSHAYHADVIIGVHGAALANAVFAPDEVLVVELKTVYGYDLDLYALVASSRKGGALAHLDVRDYRAPKGMRPVDVALLQRVGKAVGIWRSLRAGTNISHLWQDLQSENDDGVYLVGKYPPLDQGHPLGPPRKEVQSVLSGPAADGWKQYWALIQHKREQTLSR